MYRALVTGAGGFIGGHLVKRLKSEGYWVRGVDQKRHEFAESSADEFMVADLRDQNVVRDVIEAVSTRSINSRPTWAEPVIFSPATTMPR